MNNFAEFGPQKQVQTPALILSKSSPQFSTVLAEIEQSKVKETGALTNGPDIQITSAFEEDNDRCYDGPSAEAINNLATALSTTNLSANSSKEGLNKPEDNEMIILDSLPNYSQNKKYDNECGLSDYFQSVNDDCQPSENSSLNFTTPQGGDMISKQASNKCETVSTSCRSPSLSTNREKNGLLELRRGSSPADLEKYRHQHFQSSLENKDFRNSLVKIKSVTTKIDKRDECGGISPTRTRFCINLERNNENKRKEEEFSYSEPSLGENKSLLLPKFSVAKSLPLKITPCKHSTELSVKRSPDSERHGYHKSPVISKAPKSSHYTDLPMSPLSFRALNRPGSPVSPNSPQNSLRTSLVPAWQATPNHLKRSSNSFTSTSCPDLFAVSQPLDQSGLLFYASGTLGSSTPTTSSKSLYECPKIPSLPTSPRSLQPIPAIQRILPKTQTIQTQTQTDSVPLNLVRKKDKTNPNQYNAHADLDDPTKRSLFSSKRGSLCSNPDSPSRSPIMFRRATKIPALSQTEIERRFQEFSRASVNFPRKVSLKTQEDLTSVASKIIHQAFLEGEESGMDIPEVTMSDVLKSWNADDRDRNALRHVVRHGDKSAPDNASVYQELQGCRYLRKIIRNDK